MKAILIKELRLYLRGARPFTLITVYLTVISAVLLLIYATSTSSGFLNRASFGQGLYSLVLGLSLLEIAVLTPTLNASTLGGERDRQTIDLLMITPLSPLQVIVGKLVAPCLFLLLLSVATLPLIGIAFLIGGVELRDLLVGLALLVLTTIAYGTVGIWMAARSSSSRSGTLKAQGIAFLLAIGLPIIAFLLVTVLNNMQGQGSAFADWMLTSPLVRWPALAVLSLSPFVGLFSWIAALNSGGSLWFHDMPGDLGGGRIPVLWLISLAVWAVLIPLLLLRSARTLPRSVANHSGG